MTVRIPMLSKKEDMAPLQEVIREVAGNCGRSEHEIAKIMTWWLEALADVVAAGKIVRIPGFGMFAPKTKQRNWSETGPACTPVFSPSYGFRAQVRSGAPPHMRGNTALKNHDKNHARVRPTKRERSRVFTAMEQFRNEIDKQLARTGT